MCISDGNGFESLRSNRCDGNHSHATCQGQDTVLSGFYAVKLAHDIASGLLGDDEVAVAVQSVDTPEAHFDIPEDSGYESLYKKGESGRATAENARGIEVEK
jgi:hypothetical protein